LSAERGKRERKREGKGERVRERNEKTRGFFFLSLFVSTR
jgi:hypothetical protein